MATETAMDPKANGIDDFPAHWKASLLGEEFWKDAENWNKNTNDKIEADHDQNLYTRFPFNIGPEQTPRALSTTTTAADSDEEVSTVASANANTEAEEVHADKETDAVVPTKKRVRRFSMSDALNLNSLRRSGSAVSTTTSRGNGMRMSRYVPSGSRSRSHSRCRGPGTRGRASSVAAAVTSEVRRSNSMIRATLNRFTGRGRRKDSEEEEGLSEVAVQEEADVDAEEEQKEEPASDIPKFTPDQATPANPLMEFCGGHLWDALPKDRRNLGLDVFWPVPLSDKATTTNSDETLEDRNDNHHINIETKDLIKGREEEGGEEEDPSLFPLSDMTPLCTFRNLRSLKITGMMQSYQSYIFQAAWLNPNLEELELGMALPPRLRRAYKWPYIKGGWRLDKATYGEPVYYGTGTGTLHKSYGRAAYLDKHCIEKSKIRAMAIGPTRNRLSIRTLILTGIVVDADPFLHWFDPKRLKCVNFKDDCVDAGFYLAGCMGRVSVLFPRLIRNESEEKKGIIVGRKVDLRRELRVVKLEKGRKVGEDRVRGREDGSERIALGDVRLGCKGDKNGARICESELVSKGGVESGRGQIGVAF
ncbi:hypothetical protein BDV19DRAFT_392259 [Aspergillus venezuelensis]